MKVFLDTSSLVKLYHEEDGSDLVTDLLSGADEIYLSEIAALEFRSALWRKVRKGEIAEDSGQRVISYFEDDRGGFRWIRLDSAIIAMGSSLLMRHGASGLRTLDAVQLASALTLRQQHCVFLTADTLLRTFLAAEGLNVG